MANSYSGDTITTITNTTAQPLNPNVPNSGTTTITTEPFVDPDENSNRNKIISTPNPAILARFQKKVIEKPTFTVTTLHEAFESVKDTAFNNKNFFGDLIPESDLTILFGKSNTGKSMLGYQIAEAIASGKNVLDITNPSINAQGATNDFNLNNTAPAQKIVYADFEATKEKLYRRYFDKKLQSIFSPHPNLILAIPDRLTATDNLLFIEVIEEIIKTTGAKALEIDNVSAISQENEKSSNAAKLMNKIKDMQRRHNLTILILAHTPKIVRGQPILDIHLAGSSNLYNLSENVFCIGETEQSDDVRYLKQLKSRYSEVHNHKDNVIAIKFKIRDSDGFRGFEFLNYESESALLEIISKEEKNNINEEIINAVRYGFDDSGEKATPASIAKEMYEKHTTDVSVKVYIARIKTQYYRLKNKGMFNFENEQTK